MERLAKLPYEEAGFAKIDHHRRLRTGLPEVIYAAGKTPRRWERSFFAWPRWAEMCWRPAPMRLRLLP